VNEPWLLWQKVEFFESLILLVIWNGSAPLLTHFMLKRMDARQRENRWPLVHWLVLATSTPYGPLVIIPFFWRTRQKRGVLEGISVLGRGVGVALALGAVYVGVGVLLTFLTEQAFGPTALPPGER